MLLSTPRSRDLSVYVFVTTYTMCRFRLNEPPFSASSQKRATLMIHFLAFPSAFESQFAPSNQCNHSENSVDPIRRKAL